MPPHLSAPFHLPRTPPPLSSTAHRRYRIPYLSTTKNEKKGTEKTDWRTCQHRFIRHTLPLQQHSVAGQLAGRDHDDVPWYQRARGHERVVVGAGGASWACGHDTITSRTRNNRICSRAVSHPIIACLYVRAQAMQGVAVGPGGASWACRHAGMHKTSHPTTQPSRV